MYFLGPKLILVRGLVKYVPAARLVCPGLVVFFLYAWASRQRRGAVTSSGPEELCEDSQYTEYIQ